MDSFSNPLLSSSEKIYCEAGLDAPVLRPKLEDALALSSLLVNNGGTNPDLIGGSGCELTSLPLPPLAGPELFSSNPTIWDPSSFKADTQLCSGSHQFNQLQTSQADTLVAATAYAGFDGTFMPHVRAQCGKATDPHSIAERHRREKISDRTKNLHDLIPNSNKTDKATMLDEIIDYVKFLQLRINEPNGIFSSVSVGSTASISQDGTTELESEMTSATQHLQNKELCLMPIELASVISVQKRTHTEIIPTERQILDSALNGASFFSNDVRGK